MIRKIQIAIMCVSLLFISGCSTFGKEKARDTFGYEKSPCACKEEGYYFDGKWYGKRSV